MINLRIEEANNGVILKGNFGENGRHESTIIPFSDTWQEELSNNLTKIRKDYIDGVNNTITQVTEIANHIEENAE